MDSQRAPIAVLNSPSALFRETDGRVEEPASMLARRHDHFVREHDPFCFGQRSSAPRRVRGVGASAVEVTSSRRHDHPSARARVATPCFREARMADRRKHSATPRPCYPSYASVVIPMVKGETVTSAVSSQGWADELGGLLVTGTPTKLNVSAERCGDSSPKCFWDYSSATGDPPFVPSSPSLSTDDSCSSSGERNAELTPAQLVRASGSFDTQLLQPHARWTEKKQLGENFHQRSLSESPKAVARGSACACGTRRVLKSQVSGKLPVVESSRMNRWFVCRDTPRATVGMLKTQERREPRISGRGSASSPQHGNGSAGSLTCLAAALAKASGADRESSAEGSTFLSSQGMSPSSLMLSGTSQSPAIAGFSPAGRGEASFTRFAGGAGACEKQNERTLEKGNDPPSPPRSDVKGHHYALGLLKRGLTRGFSQPASKSRADETNSRRSSRSSSSSSTESSGSSGLDSNVSDASGASPDASANDRRCCNNGGAAENSYFVFLLEKYLPARMHHRSSSTTSTTSTSTTSGSPPSSSSSSGSSPGTSHASSSSTTTVSGKKYRGRTKYSGKAKINAASPSSSENEEAVALSPGTNDTFALNYVVTPKLDYARGGESSMTRPTSVACSEFRFSTERCSSPTLSASIASPDYCSAEDADSAHDDQLFASLTTSYEHIDGSKISRDSLANSCSGGDLEEAVSENAGEGGERGDGTETEKKSLSSAGLLLLPIRRRRYTDTTEQTGLLLGTEEEEKEVVVTAGAQEEMLAERFAAKPRAPAGCGRPPKMVRFRLPAEVWFVEHTSWTLPSAADCPADRPTVVVVETQQQQQEQPSEGATVLVQQQKHELEESLGDWLSKAESWDGDRQGGALGHQSTEVDSPRREDEGGDWDAFWSAPNPVRPPTFIIEAGSGEGLSI